ncbi:putative tetratricopeptide-like helical domain superfamily [Helianthus anomalus]
MVRKEVSRERKQVWDFNSTQNYHFRELVKSCAEKVGANATLEALRTLDRETGVKEFNCVIEGCIKKARNADDEDAALEEIHGVYAVLQTMSGHGFKIDEETYSPILMFIIDMGKVEEFHFFCDHIKKGNPESLQRLAYYENELLLMIKVGDEDKIQS